MDLQYWHCNPQGATEGRFTAVMDVPPKEVFEDLMLGKIDEIRIPFGFTKCHRDDNYCKAIGRNFALANCQSQVYKLDATVVENPGHIKIVLRCQDRFNPSLFNVPVLEYKYDRKRVYFLGC